MQYLDFHHHRKDYKNGIYNLELFSDAVDFPFSAGIHPKDILENNEEAKSWLMKISKNTNCVAIGECGLDGLIDVKIELQNEIFLWHIELANTLQKPIIIHCVKKHYELIPFKKISKIPMVIHGFNKNKILAQELLKNDFYLSFGKAALRNVSLQEILKEIGAENFFLETDDADFDISILYKKVAEIRGVNTEGINNQMIKNRQAIQQWRKIG